MSLTSETLPCFFLTIQAPLGTRLAKSGICTGAPVCITVVEIAIPCCCTGGGRKLTAGTGFICCCHITRLVIGLSGECDWDSSVREIAFRARQGYLDVE